MSRTNYVHITPKLVKETRRKLAKAKKAYDLTDAVHMFQTGYELPLDSAEYEKYNRLRIINHTIDNAIEEKKQKLAANPRPKITNVQKLNEWHNAEFYAPLMNRHHPYSKSGILDRLEKQHKETIKDE